MRRGIGRLRGGGGGGFNPASVFSGGRQGAVYDPSDLSTMWQEAAGSTPAVVGQPVGKILDKSGNGWHRTAPTVGQRPVLQSSGGIYWLDYTAASDSRLSCAISGWPAKLVSCVGFKSTLGTNSHAVGVRSGGSDFYGTRESASSSASWSGAATNIATLVNGVGSFPNTRGNLYTATSTTLLVEEDFGLDLSAWATHSFGGYGSGFSFGGRYYGEVIFAPANPQEVASVRAYMALKTGATVPAYSGAMGYAVGDSTITGFAGQNQVIVYMTTATSPIIDLAVAGENIAQQRTVWNASVTNAAYAKWVIVQVGLNDLDPTTEPLAAAAIARLQALIDDIRGDVSSGTKVLVSKLNPCKARLIALYGAGPGATSYQKWLDINTAIAGGGSTPITNVNARVTAHEPLLNDGSGNLAVAYDTGDGIHENNAGRQIVAQAWTDALTALGVL